MAEDQEPQGEAIQQPPSEIEKMLSTDKMLVAFNSGLKMLMGNKKLYMSAVNQSIDMTNGLGASSQAQYMNFGESDKPHLLTASILDMSSKNASVGVDMEVLDSGKKGAKATDMYDVAADLPLIVTPKNKGQFQPISSITDEQAQEAGYAKADVLKMMLEMQSSHGDQFKAAVRATVLQMVTAEMGKMNQLPPLDEATPEQREQLQAAYAQMGQMFENVTNGIMMHLENPNMMMQVESPAIANVIQQIVKNTRDHFAPQVRGEYVSHELKVPTPEELVKADPSVTLDEAKQIMGEALLKIAGDARGFNGRIIDAGYLRRSLLNDGTYRSAEVVNKKLIEVESKACEYLGIELSKSGEMPLEMQISTSGLPRYQVKRLELALQNARDGFGDRTVDEIEAEFQDLKAKQFVDDPSLPIAQRISQAPIAEHEKRDMLMTLAGVGDDPETKKLAEARLEGLLEQAQKGAAKEA